MPDKPTVPTDEELLQLAMTWDNHVGSLVETLFSEYKEVRDRAREATFLEAAEIAERHSQRTGVEWHVDNCPSAIGAELRRAAEEARKCASLTGNAGC